MRFLLSLSLLLLATGAAVAQTVVGTTVLGGKRVNLLSDGTWKYTETGTPGKCLAVHRSIEFCGSILDWRPAQASGEFAYVYSHSSKLWAGFIIEDVGRSDGVNMQGVRTMILGYAAKASEVGVSQVPVLGSFDREIDGEPAETMVYGALVNGVNVVFANTVVIEDEFTLQAVVWSIGKEFGEEHQKWTSDFVENIRITEEAETR